MVAAVPPVRFCLSPQPAFSLYSVGFGIMVSSLAPSQDGLACQ